jgi:hypothetical protein
MPPQHEEKAIPTKANHQHGHMSTRDQHISDIWTTCAQQVMCALPAMQQKAGCRFVEVMYYAAASKQPLVSSAYHWAPLVALNVNGSLTVAPKATFLPF